MENNNQVNNNVTMIGTIVSDYTYDHSLFDENFYTTRIQIQRTSGTYDTLEIMVSDRVIDTDIPIKNKCVSLQGTLRTFNERTNNNHLRVFVYVDEMDELLDDEGDGDFVGYNNVMLNGYICKKMPVRETPLGRIITDFTLAINRQYDKSAYVPCVSWGKNAKYINGLDIGTHIEITGRLQSRNYKKVINGQEVIKTAYELSVQTLKLIED